MDDVRELAERLQRVERKHQRTQLILVFVIVAAATFMLVGQAASPGSVPSSGRIRLEAGTAPQVAGDGKVRAEGFILVDAKGNERASLVTDGGGSVFLVLFDKEGKPRADMQVSNYGPSLNFYDPNAKTRLAIGSTTLVASHVSINGITERNTPSSIVLFDANGGLVWRNP